MSIILQDVIDQFKVNKTIDFAAPAPVEKTFGQEAMPIEVLLYKQYEDAAIRERVSRQHMRVAKDVLSVDQGPVRIVSLYPVIAQIFNEDVRFLNMLRTKPIFKCTDIQVRIPEEDIGSDQVNLFNMDGPLPAVQQSILSERTQTVMAFGQQVQISWLAEELAAQSPYRRNEVAAQLQKAALRLERTLNPLLLSGTEQTSESVPNIPRAGGFVTRSTYAPILMGGSNFTPAFVAQAINNLAAVFGYNNLTDVVALTNNAQLSVIRDLMINRYPGNNPMVKLEYDSVLYKRLQALGLTSEATLDGIQIYEDNSGKVIPFIREPQLPAGTTVFFRYSQPRLGGMQLGSGFGPWVVDRPITNLYDLKVMWDMKTVIDPLVSSRVVASGHP